MAWTIEFEQDAIRELNRLDKSVRRRIAEYLELRIAASGDPRQFGKPLRHDKTGLWSYQVGAYRIIALIEDKKLVVVVSIGHRRHV